MPSDTAFLQLPAADGLRVSYDSLGRSMDGYTDSGAPHMAAPGLSPRALMSVVNNLEALGIDIDENNRVLKALRTGVTAGYSAYLLYSAYAAVTNARRVRELALAASETTAAAISQQWGRIAMASAAAAIAFASFKAGEKLGSGEWEFPSFDSSNPSDRRAAARQLQSLG